MVKRILTLLLLSLVLWSGTVAAQAEETYTFESEMSFTYPSTLSLAAAERITLRGLGMRIRMYDSAGLERLQLDLSDDPLEMVDDYMDRSYPDHNFRRQRVLNQAVGEHAGWRYAHNVDGDDALLYLVQLDSGVFGLVDAVALNGRLIATNLAVVQGLASSFSYAGPAVAEAAADGQQQSGTFGNSTASQGTPDAAAAEACTIRTDDANTVRVRVGPGENRTSIAFLPADEDFEVLGTATDRAGNPWWKVDRELAAPGKAANETWVAAADVDESGDCDAVVDVNAPPIIPASNNPPPAQPPVSSGDANQGTAPSASGNTILPNAGQWVLSWGQAYGSCTGTGTFNVDSGLEAVSIAVTGVSSRGFTLDGDFYTPFSPNTYQGIFSDVVGNEQASLALTLTVTSPNSMTGTANFLYVSPDGSSCSFTVPVSVSR
jgi:hypothetical protein